MPEPIKIEWTKARLEIVINIFRQVVLPAKFTSIEETVYASIFNDVECKLENRYIGQKKNKKPFKITLKYHETALLSRYLMKYGHLCPANQQIVLASLIQNLQQTIQY
jgi:hypothetical protein